MIKAILVVCTFVYSSAIVAQTKLGEWIISDNQDRVSAMNFNDSITGFSFSCYLADSFCYYELFTKTQCPTLGGKIPILVNHSSGAFSTVMTCHSRSGKTDSDYYLYRISWDSSIGAAVAKGEFISIAVPMEKDRFVINRFDLSGGEKAVSEVIKIFADRVKNKRPSTKDSVL